MRGVIQHRCMSGPGGTTKRHALVFAHAGGVTVCKCPFVLTYRRKMKLDKLKRRGKGPPKKGAGKRSSKR